MPLCIKKQQDLQKQGQLEHGGPRQGWVKPGIKSAAERTSYITQDLLRISGPCNTGFFQERRPLVEVVSVFQVTEDVLAPFGQHVIHHIIGDMNICFGVLIISSVVQLKNNICKDKKKKGIKMELFKSITFRVFFPV